MAKAESLGPSVALDYLINEGHLPENPRATLYQRQVNDISLKGVDIKEEILATSNCVVWSFGTTIQHVFRLELEAEPIIQAVATNFQSQPSHNASAGADIEAKNPSFRRALVVFLRTKAYVHFHHGENHVLDLPFEIDCAFAAPSGCLLQRKRLKAPRDPSSTPRMPPAPPNSFFVAGPSPPAIPYEQSPSLNRRFAVTQPLSSRTLGGADHLAALFQETFKPGQDVAEDDVSPFYSLTDSLSTLGVVVSSVEQNRHVLLRTSQLEGQAEFEDLDPAEQLVHVHDITTPEMNDPSPRVPQALVVTANDEFQTLTIWHGWYVTPKSLRSLLRQRQVEKAAKARRRSSFLSASVGTGVATPAVRHRDHARQSFAAGGNLGVPPESHPSAPAAKKHTKEDEETAMASQMDPDLYPMGSQRKVRESRRISSINADMRSTQLAPSFHQGVSGRRHTSHDWATGRRSFGHRTSRGSTPGSILSRSLDLDEDEMELDDQEETEIEDSLQSTLHAIRSTFDAAGADSLFGDNGEEYKRELIMQRLHTSTTSSPRSPDVTGKQRFTVSIIPNDLTPEDDEQVFDLYIHDNASNDLSRMTWSCKARSLGTGVAEVGTIQLPVLMKSVDIGRHESVRMLRDGNVSALLLDGQNLLLPGCEHMLGPLSDRPTARLNVAKGGVKGKGSDGLPPHGLRQRLRSENALVEKLLHLCQIMLLPTQAAQVRFMWLSALGLLQGDTRLRSRTSQSPDMVAFAAMLFVHAVSMLDEKAKSALIMSNLAASKDRSPKAASWRQEIERRQKQDSAWSWAQKASSSSPSRRTRIAPLTKKDQFLSVAASLAIELASAPAQTRLDTTASVSVSAKLMLALHLVAEEQRLDAMHTFHVETHALSAIIAQLGIWLSLDDWGLGSGRYYDLECKGESMWSFVHSAAIVPPDLDFLHSPLTVSHWFEQVLQSARADSYPSLAQIAAFGNTSRLSKQHQRELHAITPRTRAVVAAVHDSAGFECAPNVIVEMLAKHCISPTLLESLPDAFAVPFRQAMSRCQHDPPTLWDSPLLRLIGRHDLELDRGGQTSATTQAHRESSHGIRDINAVCTGIEHHVHPLKTREADRHAVSRLIFDEDRRLVEATSLMHFNGVQIGECPKQVDWTDQQHLDQQRRVMQWIMVRMIALPLGDGMVHFDSQTPLMTEKYPLPGFNSTCLMQPMGHALTIDRTGLTEEKVNWAYFHAGASAGLRVLRTAKGIDTSWIAFNKPNDLTNRHAGLLLALGLGGHLKALAKWLSFKYLTPKHSMTSIGLLLGLSASYVGTMDSLITRMLSVHITRLLPPGAAELNVSPAVQTAGLMGIGLLYCETRHRRMSEIMLSEIEHMEVEDPDNGPDQLRDESYRLAAGFALGFINIGKGRDLSSLFGLRLPERLLAIARGPRPISAVHVFDKATAGAVVALAIIYMKSGNSSIARMVDIPDSPNQFDHVRPDILMMRAMARHIVMWHEIDVPESNGDESNMWITQNLPKCYKGRLAELKQAAGRHPLRTSDVPFYDIVSGLAWALSLRYAGSNNEAARDEILTVFDRLYSVKSGGDFFYYDAKLARSAVRRCVDLLALAAATVMAGSGDLKTYRYLRRLHGRVDAETTYGSHLAAHLAIGTLFLGGGTYTLGTSDMAVASLMCSFYPLFPADVFDNRVHLQAFRHMWVFAAEARCLVIEDIDTRRPIRMAISVAMKDGSQRSMTAPCLLPDLDTISIVRTEDPAYWPVSLDFAQSAAQLKSFRKNQRILVRRCPASEGHDSIFSSALLALNDSLTATTADARLWETVFDLPILGELGKADGELVLPSEVHSSVRTDERGTVVDDKLSLATSVQSRRQEGLWNLRMLFAWAERNKGNAQSDMRWLGTEFVDFLKARIDERSSALEDPV